MKIEKVDKVVDGGDVQLPSTDEEEKEKELGLGTYRRGIKHRSACVGILFLAIFGSQFRLF